jgi:D-proline reductase (dithiol) PrdB
LHFSLGSKGDPMNAVTSLKSDSELAFAAEADKPIPYMQRTRDWYLALGYGNPYRFAHYIEVPFQPLKKPISESTVTLITTAAPYQPDKGNQGPGAAYNAAAKFYKVYSGDTTQDHDLRISHVGIDRKHTSMEDSGCWFPLPALRECVNQGRIGRLAKRFHGAPTNRSQRHTIEVDRPEILRRCQEDCVDVAILVPNCPICHQTVSLTARYLEAHGIATVIMACAKDIVEHVGVPRLLFSDFPLGNGAGRPHDKVSQAATLELALRVLEAAPAPRTTVQSPQRWSDNWEWKLDFMNLQGISPEEIKRLRAKNDRESAVAKEIRERVLR